MPFGLDHQPAGFVGFRRGEVGIAGRAAIVAALVAQRVQIAEPLDVALAAAGDAIAQPVLFVDDLAVELVLVAFFLGQHLVAPGLERGKAAVDLLDRATVEPGGGARQIGQEAAVMADDDQRGTAAIQFAFQPFDGRKIEMVGRLVQQQRYRARAPAPAPAPRGGPRRRKYARDPRRRAGRAVRADIAPDSGRRRGRARPRHRPASWRDSPKSGSCGR